MIDTRRTDQTFNEWTSVMIFFFLLFFFGIKYFFNLTWLLPHEIVNNIDVIAGSNIYLNILRHH